MGGLLTAETVLLRPADTRNSKPLRHRIIGTISFDTPFLGMDPGVIRAGLGSIFRPGPALPDPPESHASGEPTVFDRFFNEVFQNDVRLPVRTTWESAAHFVTKHSQDLREATKRLIASHIEFGACMADFDGLKTRYCRIRMLEEEEDSTRKTVVDCRRTPPRVRFANYYTASTGRLKPPKIPALPAEQTSNAGAATTSTDSTVNPPVLTPVNSNARGPSVGVSSAPEREDRQDGVENKLSVPTSSVIPKTIFSDTSPAASFYSLDAPSTSSSLHLLDPAPLEDLEPTPDVDEDIKSADNAVPSISNIDSKPTLESSSNADESAVPAPKIAAHREDYKAAAKAQEAVIKAQKVVVEANRKADEARLKADFAVREAQIKTEHVSEKTTRKTLLDALKVDRKAAEDAAKAEYKKAIDAAQLALEAVHNESKSLQDAAKVAQKAEKDAAKAQKEAVKAQKDAAKAAQEAEKAKLKAERDIANARLEERKAELKAEREALKAEREAEKQALAAAKAAKPVEAPEEKEEKPKKDRHFCILPPADSAGNRDPAWIRVHMPGVDEVGAHCGLFFPTDAGAVNAADRTEATNAAQGEGDAIPGQAVATAQTEQVDEATPSATSQSTQTSLPSPSRPPPPLPPRTSTLPSTSSFMPTLTPRTTERSGVSSALPSRILEDAVIAGSAGEVGQAMGRKQGWGERYTWLVGDVAERIEEWVQEAAKDNSEDNN